MAEITIVPGTIKLVRMNDPEYFATKGISNSKLSLINPDEDGSFEKFESGFKNAYSESFALGSAVHGIVLQPDYYVISNINKPSGKLGLWAEEMYKLRKEGTPIHKAIHIASYNADYYNTKLSGARLKTAIKSSLPFYLKRMKYIEEEGKETIFMPEAMQLKFNRCLLNTQDSSSKFFETLQPTGLLSPAEYYNEYAIFCDIDYVNTDTGEVTRLTIKGKLDNFTIDHENQVITLNDLKTTGKPVNYFMGNHAKFFNQETKVEDTIWYNGSFQNYHYYRQMGKLLLLIVEIL